MSINYKILFITITLFVASCKSTKIPGVYPVNERMFSNEIANRLEKRNIPENMLIDRCNIEIGGEDNISATLRIYIKKDELIFLSGRYLGFELFRIGIGNDSVKYINRLKREYYFGNINEINNGIAKKIDFYMIQDFIYSGWLRMEDRINIRKIRNNIIVGDQEISISRVISKGEKVDLFYDMYAKLNKFNYADHNKKRYFSGEIQRLKGNPRRINGSFIKDNKKILWDLTIGEIKYKKYDNLNFVVGKNYNEIDSI